MTTERLAYRHGRRVAVYPYEHPAAVNVARQYHAFALRAFWRGWDRGRAIRARIESRAGN